MSKSAILHFDGSCEPINPGGRACGGYVIKFLSGQEFKGAAVIAERSTNNVAEWGALILGVRKALELGVTDIQIFGDSKLVINQVNGKWRCHKPHLNKMRVEAWGLLEKFVTWNAQWVRRNENSEADAMSTSLQGKVNDWKRDVAKNKEIQARSMGGAKAKEAVTAKAPRTRVRKKKAAVLPREQTLPPVREENGSGSASHARPFGTPIDPHGILDAFVPAVPPMDSRQPGGSQDSGMAVRKGSVERRARRGWERVERARWEFTVQGVRYKCSWEPGSQELVIRPHRSRLRRIISAAGLAGLNPEKLLAKPAVEPEKRDQLTML